MMLKSINILKNFVLTLGISLIFLLFKGFYFGEGNHSMFIPSIYKIANPDFLSGDWYIKALLPYHYLFKLFYAKLMPHMALPKLFFYSYCVTIVLYVTGFKKLTKVLFKSNDPFYILFPLLMVWNTAGIETNRLIHSNNFEALFLGTSIAIFAIAYFFEDSILKSFLATGLTTVVHLQIGFNMFLILVCCHIFLNLKKPRQLAARAGLPVFCSLIFFAFLIFVAKLKVLPPYTDSLPVYKNLFVDYVKFRMAHHFILSSWKDSIVKFIALCFIGGFCLKNKKIETTDVKAIIFSSILGIGILLQYVFIEIIPVSSLAKLQFFRMSIFISMFAFLYISYYLSETILKKQHSVPIFVLISAILFINDVWAACILIAGLYLLTNKKYLSLLLMLFLGLALAGILYINVYFDWLRIKSIQALDLVFSKQYIFLVITSGLLFVLQRLAKVRYCNMLIVPILVLSFYTAASHARHGLLYNIRLQIVAKDNWRKLCFWIKKNTPHSDLYIIPPYMSGFHLYAERRELVDFKSNPFLERDILEWKQRLEDLTVTDNIFNITGKRFNNYSFLKERYNHLSEIQIRNLAKKYNADYIIFRKPKNLSFGILYQNTEYIIYKIPSS